MPRLFAAALVLALCAPASAEKVLIIGDSHSVGPFGSALDAALTAKGDSVSLQAVCGANVNWWNGKRQKLSICYSVHDYGGRNAPKTGAPDQPPPTVAELAKAGPTLVIVALGSNPDGAPADVDAAVRALVAALPVSARCVWVGPPPMPQRLNAINALYQELPKTLVAAAKAGPACSLVDSRNLIQPKDAAPNDHFYGAPAIAWGKAVAQQIKP